MDSDISLVICSPIFGWRTDSSHFLSSGSVAIISLRLFRSNFPSAVIIPEPKWSSISLSAGLPGSTTVLEATSASTIVIPRDLNLSEATDLPLPIPPVSPIINIGRWYQIEIAFSFKKLKRS